MASNNKGIRNISIDEIIIGSIFIKVKFTLRNGKSTSMSIKIIMM